MLPLENRQEVRLVLEVIDPNPASEITPITSTGLSTLTWYHVCPYRACGKGDLTSSIARTMPGYSRSVNLNAPCQYKRKDLLNPKTPSRPSGKCHQVIILQLTRIRLQPTLRNKFTRFMKYVGVCVHKGARY